MQGCKNCRALLSLPRFCTFLAHSNELMQWRDVRLSVCKHFAQIASSTRQTAVSPPPNLHMMDSGSACIQRVLKVKVEVKGHVCDVIPAHLEFHKNRFFSHANGCILTKLSLSLTSPSLCPFCFLPHPNPQMAVSLRCYEFRHI